MQKKVLDNFKHKCRLEAVLEGSEVNLIDSLCNVLEEDDLDFRVETIWAMTVNRFTTQKVPFGQFLTVHL